MNRKIIFVLLLCAVALGLFGFVYKRPSSDSDRILLLLPDEANFTDPKVEAWIDAAREEGVHIVPVHDSQFVRPVFGTSQCAGLILPDSIHRKASDLVVSAIKQFVANGGKLMLVYDGATLSSDVRALQ